MQLFSQKGPAMFRDDVAFGAKWKAILTQCSYDLMLLIMEQSMAGVTKVDLETDQLKNKLQDEVEQDIFSSEMKKLRMWKH